MPHEIVLRAGDARHEVSGHERARGGVGGGDGGEGRDRGKAGVVEAIVRRAQIRVREAVDVGHGGVPREQVGGDAPHAGIGMEQQLAGARPEARVALRHDALQGLQRLHGHPAVRVG